RSPAEQRAQLIEIEPALIVDVREANDKPLVPRELQPRRDVAVVVETGANDLVALAPVTRRRARKREVERRHVGSERDLVDGRAEETCRGLVRLDEQRVRAPRGRERASGVRVRLAQVAGDRLDHAVGHLRAAGAVEERERLLQRAEAGAHLLDGRQDTRHVYSGSIESDAPTKQSRSAFAARSAGSSARGVSCASTST